MVGNGGALSALGYGRGLTPNEVADLAGDLQAIGGLDTLLRSLTG